MVGTCLFKRYYDYQSPKSAEFLAASLACIHFTAEAPASSGYSHRLNYMSEKQAKKHYLHRGAQSGEMVLYKWVSVALYRLIYKAEK